MLTQTSYQIKLIQALENVRVEVMSAKKVYPENFDNQHEAYAVILEEIE